MPEFRTVERLRQAILEQSAQDFFVRHVLDGSKEAFDDNKISYVLDVINDDYRIHVSPQELVVVGSAKLGFALHDKIRAGEVVAPAFRAFSADSDIDLSICSPSLFRSLWDELNAFVCAQSSIPYRCNRIGDYLSYGWLRLDQLPDNPNPSLQRCKQLRLTRGKVRRDRRRGDPRVDFGLFYDVNHLRHYQERSISLCRANLENPL